MPSNSVVQERPQPIDQNAVSAFDRWFEIVPADSPERIEDAHRLRYQVYCVEHSFEDPAEHPDGLEKDHYDPHSAHYLLIHRPTRIVSGAVRLILADPENLANSFPIQQVCTPMLLEKALGQDGPGELSRAAEISRFAVSKQFRRRLGEEKYADTGWADALEDGKRQMPYITLGLLRACLQMSVDLEISHVFAVMEPALIRLMRRFGLRFESIGPLVDYHGLRQPCIADVRQLVDMAAAHRRDTWLVGTDQGRLAVA